MIGTGGGAGVLQGLGERRADQGGVEAIRGVSKNLSLPLAWQDEIWYYTNRRQNSMKCRRMV